jgi:uncharacterized membrane protein YfcA
MERATVLASLSAIVVQFALMATARRDDHGIDWGTVALLMVGAIIGIPLGYAMLVQGQSSGLFRVIFGVVLLAFAANGWFSPHVRRPMHWGFGPVIGAISGTISGAFSSGGPPLVLYIYAREHDPRLAKGTLQAVFIASTAARLITIQSGRYPITWSMLQWLLLVSPFALALTLFGHVLSRRVSVQFFCWVVYGLIAMAGLVQISQGLTK